MVGSRFAPAAEANYSSTEGELLAVADALHTNKYFTLGTDTLSRYGLRHCTDEDIQNMIHDEDCHARKHLINLLATTGSDEQPSKPLLLDQDTDVINSMSPTVKPVTCQEVKLATSKDTYIVVLMNLGSSFPATKAELPVEVQPYWLCRGGLSMMVSSCTMTES